MTRAGVVGGSRDHDGKACTRRCLETCEFSPTLGCSVRGTRVDRIGLSPRPRLTGSVYLNRGGQKKTSRRRTATAGFCDFIEDSCGSRSVDLPSQARINPRDAAGCHCGEMHHSIRVGAEGSADRRRAPQVQWHGRDARASQASYVVAGKMRCDHRVISSQEKRDELLANEAIGTGD